jgi:hypothetical protein
MTNVDPEWKIPQVPLRECPHCGIRQYAQVSYVERSVCVGCGSLLGAAHPAPSKPTPVWSRKKTSQGTFRHALSDAISRGRP